MQVVFTKKQIEVLFQLYSRKFEPGTIRELAIALGDPSNAVQTILSDFSKQYSLITRYYETKKELGIINGVKVINGREWPTFIVDGKRIELLWKTQLEYKLSVEILKGDWGL
jgi:hypothetical protein